MGSTERGGPVLCVADDPDVRAALVGLGQELGVPVDPVSEPDVTAWCAAALVLLDPAAAGRLHHLPRRAGVLLVCVEPVAADPAPQVWRDAVAVGADRVVVLPAGRGWLAEAVSSAGRPRGLCVAVVGARGGAGATSTAVALAGAAAADGRRVMLVDADPWGGGIDLAVGAEELPGLRWADLHDLRGPLPPGGLGSSLPLVDGVVLLSHGRAGPTVHPETLGAVLGAAVDEHELVVVDLPRAGDATGQAAAGRADVLLCVCPCEVRAAAAAPAVIRRWAPPALVHLLVRGPSPGGLRPAEAVTAVRTGLDLGAGSGAGVGPGSASGSASGWASGSGGGTGGSTVRRVDVVRAEPRLAAALERGEPFAATARSPLRRWAAGWVEDMLAVGARGAA